MSLADLADLTSVFVDPTAYADEDRFHAACRAPRREHPVVRVESERYRPYGVHFCLGAHLARLELRVFFDELLKRVDDLQLAGEPSRSATVFVGGLKHLPVSYRMR